MRCAISDTLPRIPASHTSGSNPAMQVGSSTINPGIVTVPASSASVRHNEAENRFEIDAGDEPGVTQYIRKGDHIFFTHTEVPAAAEGQGLGNALAEAALGYAEREGLHVVPRCQFIAAYIKRHGQYQHLVDEKLQRDDD